MASGFDNVPDFGGASGAQKSTVLPVYSMIRVTFDVTGLATTTIFAPASYPPLGVQDIQGFSYGLGDANAAAAGFGTKTRPTPRHTNLTLAYRCPNSGRMAIESIAFKPEGMIMMPNVTLPASDYNDVVNDTPGKEIITDDFKNGFLISFATKLVDACYVPYFQYGPTSGARQYLGASSLFSPGRWAFDGRATAYQGPPLSFATEGGLEWSDQGNHQNLIVGLQLYRNPQNQAWSSTAATAQLFTDLAAALGVSNASPGGQAGLWVFNMDYTIALYGFRKEPLNLG